MKRFLHLETERPERAPDAQRTMRTRFDPGAPASEPGLEDAQPGLGLQSDSARRAEQSVVVPDDELANRLPPEAYAPVPTHTAARFAPDAPSLALSERDREALPFRRCAECGVDSHRFATTCQHCSADLETPAQHAFMQQVAADFARDKAAEAEQSAAYAAAQTEAARGQQQAQRAWAEAMASTTRQRVERELGEGSGLDFWDEALGKKLLRRLPTRARTPTIIGIIGVALLCMLIGRWTRTSGFWFVGTTSLSVLAALFLPPRSWSSWSRWGRRNRW